MITEENFFSSVIKYEFQFTEGSVMFKYLRRVTLLEILTFTLALAPFLKLLNVSPVKKVESPIVTWFFVSALPPKVKIPFLTGFFLRQLHFL